MSYENGFNKCEIMSDDGNFNIDSDETTRQKKLDLISEKMRLDYN